MFEQYYQDFYCSVQEMDQQIERLCHLIRNTPNTLKYSIGGEEQFSILYEFERTLREIQDDCQRIYHNLGDICDRSSRVAYPSFRGMYVISNPLASLSNECDAVSQRLEMMASVARNKNILNTPWINQLNGLLDEYATCADNMSELLSVISKYSRQLNDDFMQAETVTSKTESVFEGIPVQISKVFFSAIAPKSMVKEEYSIVDIFMYEDEFRNVVDEAIANLGNDVKETKSGVMVAYKNSKIKVVLYSRDLVIEDNIEEQVWYGEYLRFSFTVAVPENF